ncbi:hypothetical protein [Pseudomonas sp. SO81]|uniref:hypothetical protein n=1 Tax=Pseudomonas sp. SO81 TaxID=2983246 RepID=UPI0025A4C26D|nr:hypothetical protein [Pseudomonas sp. SO81]
MFKKVVLLWRYSSGIVKVTASALGVAGQDTTKAVSLGVDAMAELPGDSQAAVVRRKAVSRLVCMRAIPADLHIKNPFFWRTIAGPLPLLPAARFVSFQF